MPIIRCNLFPITTICELQVKYLLYKAKRGRSLNVSGAVDLPALGSPKKLVNDPGKEVIPQVGVVNILIL